MKWILVLFCLAPATLWAEVEEICLPQDGKDIRVDYGKQGYLRIPMARDNTGIDCDANERGLVISYSMKCPECKGANAAVKTALARHVYEFYKKNPLTLVKNGSTKKSYKVRGKLRPSGKKHVGRIASYKFQIETDESEIYITFFL